MTAGNSEPERKLTKENKYRSEGVTVHWPTEMGQWLQQ